MTTPLSIAFQPRRVRAAGTELRVVTAGEGPPLVLLHGAFQTWACWRRIMPRLVEHYSVIAPDLPGLGGSARGGAYDMFTAAAVIAHLVRELGHERFLLAGHDLGGGVGAALALDAPERVQAFAFMDMLIPGFGFEEAWVPKPDGRFLWFGALNAVPGAIETLLAGREREYISFVLRAISANPDAFAAEDVDDYAQGYAGEGGLEPLGSYFRAMWTNSDGFRSRVAAGRRIGAPVLALGGEHSTGPGAGQSIGAIANAVTAETIAGAGHWLPEERSDIVAERLLVFLAEHTP